jgi:diacylglycerol kinase (ATP)
MLVHHAEAGDGDDRAERLVSAISAAGHEVTYLSREQDDWQSVLRASADLVAVAGGDGTVGSVFVELAGRDVSVTLFPTGSANNIARSLGFTTDDPDELVAGWATAKRRPFDVASAELDDGRIEFVEALGGGLFADVLRRAEDGEEDALDAGAKVDLGVRLLLQTLEGAEPAEWELELDGERLTVPLLGVEAANIREIGPNVAVAPDADLDDGLLDVALIRPRDRSALASYLEARLRHDGGEPPSFETRRARQVVLRAPEGSGLHVDDELAQGGQARITAGTARLDVLVPA